MQQEKNGKIFKIIFVFGKDNQSYIFCLTPMIFLTKQMILFILGMWLISWQAIQRPQTILLRS